ncbi:MAG: hypothetical protein IEMM0008_1461 [bacterium]|nr:MAG: hypothetical protein IEMM0008_1461 [bacterium]
MASMIQNVHLSMKMDKMILKDCHFFNFTFLYLPTHSQLSKNNDLLF